jgi:gliding motility-associated-like protein
MNKLLSKAFLSVSLLFLSLTSVNAITKTIGGGGDYATLKAAFDAINSGSITGSIILQVQGNTTEAATPVLNASGSGSASYTDITIYPTVTGLTITGNFDMTVDLNGASKVTFDGRLYNGAGVLVGAVPDLSITNTRTSASVSTIPMAAFRFRDGASNNTVKYCKVSAKNSDQYILISTSTALTGNINNTIDHNDITNNAGRVEHAILSLGTLGKENSGTITNNNIFNTWQLGAVSSSIEIDANNIGWSIANNSIYETAGYACSQGNIAIHGIYVSSTSAKDIHIQNNYIGGNSPLCGGTLVSTGSSFSFVGIDVIVGLTSSTKSDITGNTIKNFDYSTISYPSDNNPWNGIFVSTGSTGDIDIVNNSIGDNTTTGSILVNNNKLSGISYAIKLDNTSGTILVDNNKIGSITTTMSVAGQTNAHSFEAIYKTNTGGDITISNNVIGSTTIAKSIFTSAVSSSVFGTQILYGIESQGTGVVMISNNTVANLYNASTNAGVPNNASIIGILVQQTPNYTISNNSVHDLSIACNNTASNNQSTTSPGSAVYGIASGFVSGVSTPRFATINDNTVYNLSNSHASFGGNIYGIYTADDAPGIPTVRINRNFIHSLSVSATSSTARITGMLGVWNSPALNDNYSIANNIIYLNGNTATELIGISADGSKANTISYQHNTIYIEGTPTAGSNVSKCLNIEATPKCRVRNNIFYNARTKGGASTGKHYGAYFTGVNSAEVDYNLYYTPNAGGVLGYYKSDVITLPVYKFKDHGSISLDPNFDTAGGGHVKTQAQYYQTCTSLQGVPVTTPVAITSDYGNITIRKVPYIGAWEGGAPGMPSPISGDSTLCAADSKIGLVYSTTATAGASTYTWTVPSGWNITAPSAGSTITTPSTTITVDTDGSTSGYVTVVANGTCAGSPVSSQAQKLYVKFGQPAQPGAITRFLTTGCECADSTLNFQIASVPGATKYVWNFPPEWVPTPALTGTTADTLVTIKKTKPASTTYGVITVAASNECGTSAISSVKDTVFVTPLPTVGALPNYCSGKKLSDLPVTATAPKWYATAVSTSTIPSSTTLVDATDYYVTQTLNGCESPRLKITVTVLPSPAKLIISTPKDFCKSANPTVWDLLALVTPDPGDTLICYSGFVGANELKKSTLLDKTKSYYISQTNLTCEGPRSAAVKVRINDPLVPTVIGGGDTVRFCAGATPKVSDFKLQLVATGGTPVVYSTNLGVVPMLNTDPVVDMVSYYVTKDSAGCESTTRHKITVKIADPAAPTGTSPQKFCQSANPNVGKLQATGATLKWYAAAVGGAPLDTATTMLVDGTTYYATQTVGLAPNPTCESTTRLAIKVNLLPDNIVSLTSLAGTAAQVLCKGDALENIVYHVSGTLTGVTPSISPALPAGVTSNWDGTAGDLTISGTPTSTQALKTYTVSLTGACGTSTKTFDITVNAVPAKPVVNTTDPACGAANVGIITVTTPAADGGTTTFSIDGVDYSNITGVFNNVAPATYNVTAKSNNCTSPATSVTINNQPPLPSAPTVGVIVQPTCAVNTATVPLSGLPAGAWTVTESVGSTALNGSGSTANFTGLAAGKTYTFTVTSGSCTSVASLPAVVNAAPTPPAAPILGSITQPTCTVATGTIVITTQAGVEYSVGGAYQASGTFAGLTPGNYTLSVRSLTDNTCMTTGTTETINPQPVTPADPILAIVQSTCASSANSITITNTVAGNSYSTDGVDYSNTTGVFNNLAANTYSVTAKSSGGCVSKPVSATITAQPVTPPAPIVDTVQATCASASNSITIKNTAAGNTYSVDGVDYSNTTGVFNNLAANTYSVTAKSTGGCVSTATSVIIKAQPVTPAAPLVDTVQATCGSANNSITIKNTVAGNTYSVDGVDYSNSTGVFSNLPANTYSVTAKSTGGCVSPATQVIIKAQPATPSAPAVGSIIQPTCDVPTGSVSLSGLPVGNWTITDTKTTLSVTGNSTFVIIDKLSVGTHTFTVTNDAGCTSLPTSSVLINPVVNNTIVLTSAIGTDAQTLESGNKITDITYKTTGANGATFVELPSGVAGEWKDSIITIKGTPTAEGTFNYVINLTGGCGSVPKGGVIKVDPSEIGIPNAFSPNGDGTNDKFTVKKSPTQILKLQVFSRWGTLVYENNNFEGEWDGKGSGAMEGQDLLSGTYYYVIQVRTNSGSTPKEYTGYITLKR